jgi:hypothetical protein
MLSTIHNYDRILDGKYGIVRAFNPNKDKDGLSVVKGVDLRTNESVAIKIMGLSEAKMKEFEEEVEKNSWLPDG